MELKQLFDSLSPERGFIVQEVLWENRDGEEVTILAVTHKKNPGSYFIEKTKYHAIRPIGQPRYTKVYNIYSVTTETDNDTGLVDQGYDKVAEAHSEYAVITEIAALFVKNDIALELQVIEYQESNRLAEEYYKEAEMI